MDMKTKFHRWSLLMLAALTLGLIAPSCSDDDTESSVSLHYADIGDIGPSMHYTTNAPSFKGAAPSEFTVESVKFNDALFNDVDHCFTATPATGAIVIANTNSLLPGRYSLTVSCMAGGQRNVFPDILSVKMLAATPAEILITPSVLEIAYDGVLTSELSAQITPKDEAVTINKYELVQAEGQEYFIVSNSGAISINREFKGDILPGVYTPGVKLASLAGAAIYESMITIKITSQPLEVAYKPVLGRSEFNMAFNSPVPTVKGSSDEGVLWAIKEVTPATDQFTIDPATGVISLAKDNGLPIESSYALDLSVTNQYGTADFVEAYSVKIVAFITPIDPATFAYADTEAIEACAFTISKKAGFVGDEVNYEFGELVMPLVNQLSIDSQTGEISVKKGNTIPIGTYDIPVKVSNNKSEASATAKLIVKANPNMFYKFGYGNNLGLPTESNFDQFRWDADGKNNLEKTMMLTDGYNDFNGRKPVFKLEIIHNWAIQKFGDATLNYVDEEGNLHLFLRGDRSGQIGYVRVTATLGEGETAVSRSTIVFVMLRNENSAVIEYTPYVLRSNPRNGGVSGVKPTFGAGVDKSKVMMSWRQNGFLFEGLNDEVPYGGKLEAGQTARSISRVWASYETNGIVNAASRLPFSFYDVNGNKDDVNMARKVGYFDPNNEFQIYIAPNKWVVDGKAINGILTFQASYSITANNADLGGTKTLIGCAVWLDEKF